MSFPQFRRPAAPVRPVFKTLHKFIRSAPAGYTEEEDGQLLGLAGYPTEFFRKIEQAGEAYERLGEIPEEVLEEATPEEVEDDVDESDDVDKSTKEKMRERRRNAKSKGKASVAEPDYYELLGIASSRWTATDEEVRKAYRRRALELHPDKNGGDDTQFKLLSKAFETLGDPSKRRSYDSKANFDDWVPSGLERHQDFYELYGPVFARNTRFSTKQPVPGLGDAKTPWSEVVRFYNFWKFEYQTWRMKRIYDKDGEEEEEFDLETASCSAERSWMKKENERIRRKGTSLEMQRIKKLVDSAYANDPRVKKNKDMEREKREAATRAREELQQKALADKFRKDEDEKKRIVDEEKRRQDEQRQKEAALAAKEKLRDTAKQGIRNAIGLWIASQPNPLKFSSLSEQVEFLLMDGRMTTEELDEFGTQLKAVETAKALDVFKPVYTKYRSAQDEILRIQKEKADADKAEKEEKKNQAKQQQQAASAAASSLQSGDWSDKELTFLAKALVKYVSGYPKRFEAIAAFMGGTRTPDQIMAKVNEMKVSGATHSAGQTPMSSSFDNWKSNTNASEKGKRAEAKASISEISINYDTPNAAAAPSSPAPSSPAPAAAASPSAAATKPAVTKAPAAAAAAKSDWTTEMQKALETGLRQFPATQADRWDKIAEMVGNKTKAECMARYKELVAKFKAAAPAKK